jgi:hypothetical protein
MRRLWSIVLLSSLLLALHFMYYGGFPEVKASPDVFQGNLILSGNNVTTIENMVFDINGSIIVEGNATLVLKNAEVNLAQTEVYQYNMSFQNSAGGNPRLFAENSTITSSTYFLVHFSDTSVGALSGTSIAHYLDLRESCVVSVHNSTIDEVTMGDNASLSIFNSAIGSAEVYARTGSPSLYADNCTIGLLMTSPIRVEGAVANINPGIYEFWNYQLNTSLVTAPGGGVPNATLKNSAVSNWAFWFQISCNVTMSDSALSYLRSYSNSVCQLVNVTANQHECWMQGEIYVSWYLDVHVLDSVDQNVGDANVTAAYPDATITESELTKTNGWTRFTLTEKKLNETGEYPVGNYTIEAAYDTYSNSTTLSMAGNQQIALALAGLVVPEFPSFLILPLFMIAALLGVIVYRKKRSMKPRPGFEPGACCLRGSRSTELSYRGTQHLLFATRIFKRKKAGVLFPS